MMERKPSQKSNRPEGSSKHAKEKNEDAEHKERKQKLNFYQQSEEGSSDNINVNIAESDQINDSDDIIFQQSSKTNERIISSS